MPNPTSEPPPGGDQQRAESYIKQLIQLLTDNKLTATHTDLTKFDPNALQDHYRIDIKTYQLEVSHSKQPATGKDIYVLLFINSPSVDDFYNAHGIIAYLVLSDDQFKRFKAIADEQIETRRKVEEEKRFAKAIKPIEELLDKIAKGENDTGKSEPIDEPIKKVEETKPLVNNHPPTLADVQEAMHQAATESAPKPPNEFKEATRDHNLDIPQVVTLPPNDPPPPPPPSLSTPIPVAVKPEPIQTEPTPPQSQQPAMVLPLGNVLTESMPTGSQALPPSGIDQAIDQAFQTNSNNTITPQTPPIGIN